MINQPIEEKWQEFFRFKENTSDVDVIGMLWSKCCDMGSEDGALMSVKRVGMFTEGLLFWHKKAIENLLEQERNNYEKELKIADERWKRAEDHHREKHESETEVCVYH